MMHLMGGIFAAIIGILMVFSKMPFGIIFLLAGIAGCVYGGVLLNTSSGDALDFTTTQVAEEVDDSP